MDSTPAPAEDRRFPDDLEAALVARAHARMPRSTPTEAIDRVWRAASALSDLFTTHRPARFPDYAADADLRLAYGLYVAPQTWVRARFPLAEALDARGWRPRPRGSLSVLDLGAGLGTAGWSLARRLLDRGFASRARVVAVDRSPSALATLEDLAREGLPSGAGLEFVPREGDLARAGGVPGAQDGPFDLVVLSFAWNEAYGDGEDEAARRRLRDLADVLVPDGLLVLVEPALRATAQRLRTLAAPLVAAGVWHVLAPDLDDRIGPPPADPRFFDHEVRRWRPPRSVKVLNRRLRRSLDELTFAALVLSPTAPAAFPPTPRRTRLTSPWARLKGRLACTGCDADGTRTTYDLLERHLSEEERARVRAVERGDHVWVDDPQPQREPGWLRIPRPGALRVAWHP